MNLVALLKGNLVVYCSAGIFVFGFLLKWMVAHSYKKLVKSSENLGISSHRFSKEVKHRFETAFGVRAGVNNVDSFVDKYIYHYKVMGIHLYAWENIAGQATLINMIITVIGGILTVGLECDRTIILSTCVFGFLSTGLLIFWDSLLNIGTKKKILHVNTTEFLENTLMPRLEHQGEPRRGQGKNKKTEVETEAEPEIEPESEPERKSEPDKKPVQIEFSKEEERVIAQVLNEFMM